MNEEMEKIAEYESGQQVCSGQQSLLSNSTPSVTFLFNITLFYRLMERSTPLGTSWMTRDVVDRSQRLTAKREADGTCATGVELNLTM